MEAQNRARLEAMEARRSAERAEVEAAERVEAQNRARREAIEARRAAARAETLRIEQMEEMQRQLDEEAAAARAATRAAEVQARHPAAALPPRRRIDETTPMPAPAPAASPRRPLPVQSPASRQRLRPPPQQPEYITQVMPNYTLPEPRTRGPVPAPSSVILAPPRAGRPSGRSPNPHQRSPDANANPYRIFSGQPTGATGSARSYGGGGPRSLPAPARLPPPSGPLGSPPAAERQQWQ